MRYSSVVLMFLFITVVKGQESQVYRETITVTPAKQGFEVDLDIAYEFGGCPDGLNCFNQLNNLYRSNTKKEKVFQF